MRRERQKERRTMARTVSIGRQDFEKIRINNNFYIDKTHFIQEWWDAEDDVTLITRPRRFGKTLNMSMLEQFFSVKYSGRGDLFEGLAVWREERYRQLQGTYPVIALSFADIKENTCQSARKRFVQIIAELYNQYDFLLSSDRLNQNEKALYQKIAAGTAEDALSGSLRTLSYYLMQHYGKKVLIGAAQE